MKTTIVNRDLTQQAPHSPRERFGGFAILGRTVDKCRASLAGKLGEYHYDCALDNQLFGFKGVTGEQFKGVVKSAQNYEDVAAWLEANGAPKTPEQIRAWSDEAEARRLADVPAIQKNRDSVADSCKKLGLDFESATLFEWLEADDQASYQPTASLATK